MDTKEYIRSLIDEELVKLCEFARERFIPAMLPECATQLMQTVMLKNPRKILEVGTGNGFSGICMLKAAPEARLYTIEHNESRVKEAKANFEAAGVLDRVTVYTGDAYGIIPYVSGEYDFIFLDGPKGHYLDFYTLLKPNLAKGGVLYCDNVLFRGYVSGEKDYVHRMNTIVTNMREFLETISKDPDLVTGIYDIGDGVSVSIKKR